MNNVEYVENSNRIPSLIDPATGEVRPAGSFTNAEWKRIVRDNPDAATLILQLRRRENEIETLEGIANNSIGAGIGAVSAGISYPLLNAIAPEIGQRLNDEWRSRTWAKLDDEINRSGNVVLKTSGAPGGGIELLVDGKTIASGERPSKDLVRNINNVVKELPAYLAGPGKGRVYFAAPQDIDGRVNERSDRLKKAGFQVKGVGGSNLYTIDKRPGAEFIGRGYDLIDDLIFRNHLLEKAKANLADGEALTPQLARSANILKGLRFAGALTGALGLGSLIGGGVNFINERI